MVTLSERSLTDVRREVGRVTDPEIPFLTIADLGILRDVYVEDGETVVVITPTYSGCPAMAEISSAVEDRLAELGVDGRIETRLSPPWTTDDITSRGRELLAEAAIAPPEETVRCPNCDTSQPRMVSFFGATACQALMVCEQCGEPFNHFKVHRL